MPQVVQIQRAPNSWDQAGQTVQQTADNFLKSMLAMGQMQSNNALHMATLNLQNQRIADANARQDKQLAAIDARHKEDSAQRLQMHNDTMALHRAQMAQAGAAMNKSQVVMTKGPYGEDVPVLFNPRTQQVSPFPTPGMGGGAGGAMGGGSSNAGLDAAVNEVLSPNWSPTSGGGQQDTGSMYDNGVRAGLLKPLPSMSGFGGGVDTPSPIAPIPTQAEVQLSPVTLDAPKPTNPLYELGQRAGIFPQTPLVKPDAPQYSDNAQPAAQPQLNMDAPSTQQQNPSGTMTQNNTNMPFKPGAVYDTSWNQMDGVPDSALTKQTKRFLNGVEVYGVESPNGRAFKPMGLVAKDQPDTLYKQELAKEDAKHMSAYKQQLESDYINAQQSLPDIQATEAMLNAGLQTGWGTEAMAGLSNVLQRFGFTDNEVKGMGLQGASSVQAARSIVERNVLNKLAAQKGVQTEGDAQRARQTGFMLANTPEANKFINQYAKNLAERTMQRTDFIISSLESGMSRREAERAWAKRIDQLPPLVPDLPGGQPTMSGASNKRFTFNPQTGRLE